MQNNAGGFLHPEKILEQMDIRGNMKVADFGCGHGYFSIPLAKAVNQGKVYALDVMDQALESVTSKAELEGISNIETVRCNLEVPGGSKLEENSMDLIFLVNILFQSQKKPEILKEAKRVLKPSGQLIIIDWIVGSSLAPREGWLISKEQVQSLTETEGFGFDRELEMDVQHYGLLFKNP